MDIVGATHCELKLGSWATLSRIGIAKTGESKTEDQRPDNLLSAGVEEPSFRPHNIFDPLLNQLNGSTRVNASHNFLSSVQYTLPF